MLAQPHSSVIVLSSRHAGRTQNPVRVGQVDPEVSVIVTQVGDPDGPDEISPARTSMGWAANTAARKENVENCIFDDAKS